MVNNREDDRQKAKGSGPMFLGTYTPKLDDKGSLTLPAKFREELAGGVMVTKGQDHCLAVYPREEFVQLARRAAKAPRTKPEARAFLRSLAAGTDEQFPDSQGRVTLSMDHRRYAELHKECVVIGAVDYVEIWNADAWAEYEAANEQAFSDAQDDSLQDIL